MEETAKCNIVVNKETKATCGRDALVFMRPATDEESYGFNICEGHQKLLNEGKTFIVQDTVSNGYLLLQFKTDTIKESQFEPPLGQEDTTI